MHMYALCCALGPRGGMFTSPRFGPSMHAQATLLLPSASPPPQASQRSPLSLRTPSLQPPPPSSALASLHDIAVEPAFDSYMYGEAAVEEGDGAARIQAASKGSDRHSTATAANAATTGPRGDASPPAALWIFIASMAGLAVAALSHTVQRSNRVRAGSVALAGTVWQRPWAQLWPLLPWTRLWGICGGRAAYEVARVSDEADEVARAGDDELNDPIRKSAGAVGGADPSAAADVSLDSEAGDEHDPLQRLHRSACLCLADDGAGHPEMRISSISDSKPPCDSGAPRDGRLQHGRSEGRGHGGNTKRSKTRSARQARMTRRPGQSFGLGMQVRCLAMPRPSPHLGSPRHPSAPVELPRLHRL